MTKSNKNDQTVYKANLQRCGALISETITVLEEYNDLKNWNELKEKVNIDNILNKKSSTTINGILNCIRKRYKDIDDMPNLEDLSRFIASDVPNKAKIQVLFPYLCTTDPLIEQYVLNMIGPNINSLEKQEISKETFLDFLEKETKTHPELDKWSDYLKKRWIRGLISLLRNFYFMDTAPSFELDKPSLRIETFFFYCLWLLLSGKRGIHVLESEIWRFFILSDSEIEKFLEDSQRKGWLLYHQSGDIISITTEYQSLEEWVNVVG